MCSLPCREPNVWAISENRRFPWFCNFLQLFGSATRNNRIVMGGLCSDERKQNRTYQVECSLRRNQHEGDSSMQRRDFIKSVAAAGIIGTGGRRAHTAETGWRQFEITYRINIKDSAADTDV